MAEKIDIMFQTLHKLGSLRPVTGIKKWFYIDLAVNSFSPVLVIITMTTNSNPKLGF